ncbi:MAG: DUF1570 domain-containing protein [Pirellulales bacterium]|nr:DUF1570 domain-containing protein [Pirellulales bacterium]
MSFSPGREHRRPPTARSGRRSRAALHGLVSLALAAAGCHALNTKPASTLPLRREHVRDQLIIHSDFDMPERHRLVEELCAQRSDLAVKLMLPTSDEPIHVYLFDKPNEFSAYMRLHYPELGPRRAFFVEGDTRLAVYAQWGDRVAEDLRHEVAHGYLHAVVPNLPLWLDEGLAEYFEVPRGTRGVNRPHVEALLAERAAGTWSPSLQRIEAIHEAGQLQQRDYAEAWAWVHWMLESTPERREQLCRYLQTLRQSGVAPPLSLAIGARSPQAEQELVTHLEWLRGQ